MPWVVMNIKIYFLLCHLESFPENLKVSNQISSEHQNNGGTRDAKIKNDG